MEYEQRKGSVRRKFTLHENHISISSTPFLGNHTETNYEYKAVTKTVSNALIRPSACGNYLWGGFLILIFAALFLFNENQPQITVASVMGGLALTMFVMSFKERKRIPFQVFHNQEGAILFDIGGNTNEYNEFVSELKRRISFINGI